MATKNPDVDYKAELVRIRADYVGANPRQRMKTIRDRIRYKDSGPNNLVNAVSAVEGFARVLLCRAHATKLGGVDAAYVKYRSEKPRQMIEMLLAEHGHGDPGMHFGEDTWELLGYAVEFRNMIIHECTYIGQDKSPSLLEACNEAMTELARLAGLDAAEVVRDMLSEEPICPERHL